MFLIIIGALFGAAFGGFGGLIIGGAIGYFAGIALRNSIIGGLKVAQSQLLDSTFTIMGAVCKADNVVTRDEINTVEKIFRMLNLNEEQKKQAKAAFNRGKQPDFDLDAAVDRFASVTRGRGPLVQLFLQLQVMAVAADGRIDPAEHRMLVRIANRLGLHESDVAQLEALLRAAATGRTSGAGMPPTRDRPRRCIQSTWRNAGNQWTRYQACLSQAHQPESSGQARITRTAGEHAPGRRRALTRNQFCLRPDQGSAARRQIIRGQ